MSQPDPSRIMQIGMGFFASKCLLSAVELELFTHLADEKLSGEELRQEMDLHERSIFDFLDALVSLDLLNRVGKGPEAKYFNTEETAIFLDKNSPHYMGGILEMSNERLYPFWANLTEGLKTGKPQNEIKEGGEQLFAKLYKQPERLKQFMNAMAGVSAGNFRQLAEKFDFSPYETLLDAGGATGQLCCMVAAQNPKIKCTTYDLPPVKPIAESYIEKAGLTHRVKAVAGNFFEEELPQADVITMGMILHDWNLEEKKALIEKVYRALPEGGAFIAIEALIDDDRRENSFGLLMSLNMLIETPGGFDYTFVDFKEWCTEVGFSEFEKMELAGPSSAAIAYK